MGKYLRNLYDLTSFTGVPFFIFVNDFKSRDVRIIFFVSLIDYSNRRININIYAGYNKIRMKAF